MYGVQSLSGQFSVIIFYSTDAILYFSVGKSAIEGRPWIS